MPLIMELHPFVSDTMLHVFPDIKLEETKSLRSCLKYYKMIIDKFDIPQPTQEEVDAERAILQTEWNAQDYARNRKDEYPDLAEQLDYIYHNGITKWKSDMIKPVKDKYPK